MANSRPYRIVTPSPAPFATELSREAPAPTPPPPPAAAWPVEYQGPQEGRSPIGNYPPASPVRQVPYKLQ